MLETYGCIEIIEMLILRFIVNNVFYESFENLGVEKNVCEMRRERGREGGILVLRLATIFINDHRRTVGFWHPKSGAPVEFVLKSFDHILTGELPCLKTTWSV